MIGFEANVGKFFWFLGIMFMTLCYFTYAGQLSVHLTPSMHLAEAIIAVIFGMLQLFCGYLKPRPRIPDGWIWAYWTNPVSYTLYGLVSNQLGDVQTPVELPSGVKISVERFVEQYYGFKHSFYPWTIVILIPFIVVFRLGAYLAVRHIKFQNR